MRSRSALIAGLVCLATFHSPAGAVDLDMRMPAHRFYEIRLPRANGSSIELVSGPDRNLWVVQQNPPRLLRVSALGELAKVPLPAGLTPHAAAFDGNGDLWLAMKSRNTLAKISTRTGKVMKEYSVSQPERPDVGPVALVAGRDRNTLWFAGQQGNLVGKIDTGSGEVVHYPLSAEGGQPTVVSLDRAGNVWFNQTEGDRIGFINPEGFMFDFPLPEGSSAPIAIAADPKQPRVWFAPGKGGVFGHINTRGEIEIHPLPTPAAQPAALCFDRKGVLWLGFDSPDAIAFVEESLFGKSLSLKEYALPTQDAGLRKLISGPDGNLWFIESGSDKLGSLLSSADYGK